MIDHDKKRNPPAGRLAKAARERLLFVAVLAIGTIVWIGFQQRGDREVQKRRDTYWATKIRWRNCADVAVAGDSRTSYGISPKAMSSCLDGRRVVNFGLNGAGHSSGYMQAVEELLEPASDRKMIVMGITPLSLTCEAAKDEHLKALRARHISGTILDGWARTYAKPVLLGRFLRSLYRSFFASPSRPRKKHRCALNFHNNGWIAGAAIPGNPKSVIREYRKIFSANQADESLINGILRHVARWRRAGIEVYGFRPPTTAAMVALENKISGFDEPSFVAAFRQAGGIWIHVDQTAYSCFDGSHLCCDEAERLSQHLGRAISAMEPKEARPLKPDAPPRKDPND